MTRETEIKKAIITLAIVVLAGGIIKDYLTIPKPVLYMDDSCYYNFNKEIQDFSITLRNMGDVSGLATLCVTSKEFVLKSESGDFVHQLCFSETEISPKQTDLNTLSYPISAKPDANIFDSTENATMEIDVSCRQKIWSIFSRECQGRTKFCKYTKDKYYGYLKRIN